MSSESRALVVGEQQVPGFACGLADVGGLHPHRTRADVARNCTPNSIPPSSNCVIQRTTPMVQRGAVDELDADHVAHRDRVAARCRRAAQLQRRPRCGSRRPTRAPGMPSRSRRRERRQRDRDAGADRFAFAVGSRSGCVDDEVAHGLQAHAHGDGRLHGSRRCARFGGSPQSVMSRPMRASDSGVMLLRERGRHVAGLVRVLARAQLVDERRWCRAAASWARPRRRSPRAWAWAACRCRRARGSGRRAASRGAPGPSVTRPRRAANLREDRVGFAGHEPIGIGERQQQRLAVEVGRGGLRSPRRRARRRCPASRRRGRAGASPPDRRAAPASTTCSSRAARCRRYSIARATSSGSCFFAPNAISFPVFSAMAMR